MPEKTPSRFASYKFPITFNGLANEEEKKANLTSLVASRNNTSGAEGGSPLGN